jgi:hypothetical protein
LTQKRQRTEEEESQHQAQETERWNVVGDAASRLTNVLARDIHRAEDDRSAAVVTRLRSGRGESEIRFSLARVECLTRESTKLLKVSSKCGAVTGKSPM